MKRSGYKGESSGKKPKKGEDEQAAKGRKRLTLQIYGAPREIEVLVTGDERSVNGWIGRAVHMDPNNDQLIFGLNVHETSKKKLATIELAMGSRCLVFQVPHGAEVPQRMLKLFAHTGNFFVTYGDMEKTLGMLNHVGITVSKSGDMRSIMEAVKNKLPATVDWKRITRERIGLDLKQLKEPRQPNWNGEGLKDEEWKFACMLVFFASEVGQKFLGKTVS